MKVFIYPILLFFLCLSPAISAADGLLTSSDLPIVLIDTNGQIISDEPKIEAQMGIIDNGQGIRNYSGSLSIAVQIFIITPLIQDRTHISVPIESGNAII